MKRFGALALLLVVLVSVVGGPLLATGSAAAVPSGMTTIPDGNISEQVPANASIPIHASDLQGGVLTDRHAATLDVVLTTPEHADTVMGSNATVIGGGEVAIVLRDEANHDGRRVAVDAGVLRQALGHSPKMVYGTHDDGSTWHSSSMYVDGYLSFDVDHFSSNTITFASQVNITATPATDGSSVSYGLSSLDAASDPQVTFTGQTVSEWDNITGSAALPSSTSVSIGGNADPTGPGDTPVLTVINTATAGPFDPASASSDANLGYDYSGVDILIQDAPATVTSVTLRMSDSSGTQPYDVYIANERPDKAFGEGSLVKDDYHFPDTSTKQNLTIPIQTYHPSAANVTLSIVKDGSNTVGYSHLKYEDGDGPADGLTIVNNSLGHEVKQATAGAWLNHEETSSLSVSTDATASKSLGTIPLGGSSTVPFNITTAATSLSWSGSGAPITYSLEMQERTQTVDPAVEVNGHWLNSTGTLADGASTTLTGESSWLQSGTNRINISVGDGTLTADAPSSSVDLVYNHSAQDDQTVLYDAQKWSERYNVSKTFASSRSDATLTIPFSGFVYGIRDVETSVNGSAWSTVGPSSRSLSNTTLTVDLGGVDTGATVRIRANGSRVAVNNGSIQVLDPTMMGQSLDTRFQVTSWNRDSYIDVAGTPDGTRIHYLYNESWASVDEFDVVTADGKHMLHLPNAVAGVTARVATIPVRVDAASGQMRIRVPHPQETTPSFVVSPGASAGDTVMYTLLNALADTDYLLFSRTHEVVRDSGTAHSPVTLTDDDSAETLEFRVDSSTGSTSSGIDEGGMFGGPISPDSSSPLNSVPVVLLAWAGTVIALFVVDARITSSGGVHIPNPVPSMVPVIGGSGWSFSLPGGRGPLFWVGSILSGLIVFEYLSGGAISGGIATAIGSLGGSLSSTVEQVGPLAGIVAVGLVGYYAYKRFIRGQDTTVVVRGSE